MADYIQGEEFRKRFQSVYISRLGGASASPVGNHKDLRKSMERLRRSELVPDVKGLYYGWLPMFGSSYAGHSSSAMRAVSINRRLDNENVPDDLVDYVLYSQMVFVGPDYNPKEDKTQSKYRRELEKYPCHDVLDEMLEGMGLRITREMSPEC